MPRINLLPWREELRKQRQQAFFVSIGVAVLVILGILFLVHLQINAMIDYQQSRNELLQDQIAVLDKRIVEIKDIEKKKAQLLAKIELIQRLQESRPQIVHLFDEMARTTPEGVFLTGFKQTGNRLVIEGKAKSNARVSAYMRAIEASPWLKNPKLNIIRSDQPQDKLDKLSDFIMYAEQGKKEKPDQKKGKKR